jgi:ribose/xylose/arabinose/galactoside ABC-type transport system permease subunit
MSIPKLLVTLGVILLVAGLLWPWLSKLGLGRLPGDIAIKRDGFSFYFPITTSILLSLVLSLIVWLLRK